MPRLGKEDLLERILRSVRAAGWNVVFLKGSHPYDLTVFKGEQSFRVRLYVWNVTHGGGPKRSPSEYRIQITSVPLPLVAPVGFQTLLFGWNEDLHVVAAFDPERHRRPSAASPSIQIPISTLQEASARGLAVRQRGNEEIALAFQPEFLVTYVENQRALHDFAPDLHAIEILKEAGAGEEIPAERIESVPRERERVIRMIATRRREAGFRRRVLAAYNERCAMCHLQLDLVEGAHILPVGDPRSTDDTDNGLALCSLHHEAYDDALVGVRPDYRIIVNETVIKDLRKARRAGEEERFRDELQPRILLPSSAPDRPRPEYLQQSLEVRGWRVA
ncbi:MAG: HNH endonuclease [Planctomycetota bacterium]